MPQVVKNFPLVVSGLKLYHSLSQPAYCAIKKTLQKEDFAQYFNIFKYDLMRNIAPYDYKILKVQKSAISILLISSNYNSSKLKYGYILL